VEVNHYLAFDLGAESGRAILGRLEKGRLGVQEIHRFENKTVRLQNHLHWNLYYLFEEIRKVLQKCRKDGLNLTSLGVDTWGVDFGLLDSSGNILALPYCYRDKAFPGAMEKYFQKFEAEELYSLTGIQFLPFNSLFQLYAYHEQNPALMAAARKLLFMPDLFNYLLTGEQATELTIASTSQMLSPSARNWLPWLLERMGISADILPKINQPGEILGKISSWLAEDGLPEIPVVQVASHDTASAVAAAPGQGDDWLYISSGTWSLVGVELEEPVVSPGSFSANFTNESGLNQTIRFLKNVTGLWPLQQCRKIWSKQRGWTYGELVDLASRSEPFQVLLDLDSPDFLHPENMVSAIIEFSRRTKQEQVQDIGSITRAILESLAFKYRLVIEELQKLTGRKFRQIQIIGGGSKNWLLNKFTAEATGLKVYAGPDEATSAGNILVQALATGQLKDIRDIRKTIRHSFEIEEFQPENSELWHKHYSDFLRILTGSRR